MSLGRANEWVPKRANKKNSFKWDTQTATINVNALLALSSNWHGIRGLELQYLENTTNVKTWLERWWRVLLLPRHCDVILLLTTLSSKSRCLGNSEVRAVVLPPNQNASANTHGELSKNDCPLRLCMVFSIQESARARLVAITSPFKWGISIDHLLLGTKVTCVGSSIM